VNPLSRQAGHLLPGTARKTIPNTTIPDTATHSIKRGNYDIKEEIATANGKIAISILDLLTLNVGRGVVDLTAISTKVFSTVVTPYITTVKYKKYRTVLI
jgi:hypothetical protein